MPTRTRSRLLSAVHLRWGCFATVREVQAVPQVVFDFPPDFFSALRKSPCEFAAEMRLAAAIHWYSQGLVSQGKAAEIAGLDRAGFLDELYRRKVPAVQISIEELREELVRDR